MKSTRQLIKQAKAGGFILQRTNGHMRWQHPMTGAIVTIPHSMKSESISKKIEMQIRRGQP